MRPQLLSYLSDPITHTAVTLTTTLRTDGDHVADGILTSGEQWYPIIDGVPRLLCGSLKLNLLQQHYAFFQKYKEKIPDDSAREWQAAIDAISDFNAFWKHQKKTAESFAYEWKYIYKENDYEKKNFFHFLHPFLKESDLSGKVIVDIGCGSGRFTKWGALSGAAVAIGTDVGETVTVAYALTKDIPNVLIVQADIYAMPLTGNADIAYSIGVLHHLPRPQKGFLRLPRVLKKDGRMLIWVYNRRNNARALYVYEPLRAILRHLPKPLLFKLCYIPGGIVHLINLSGKFLEKMGQRRLAQKLPFAYYANFPFNMKLNDAFDVLATPKSNYYCAEDIERWFRAAHLHNVKNFEHPEAGITCIGTRS